MKDPMRLVDRFLYKHPNFGIPGLARYIAIASGAVWVIGLINSVLYAYLAFSAAAVKSFCSITIAAPRFSSAMAL